MTVLHRARPEYLRRGTPVHDIVQHWEKQHYRRGTVRTVRSTSRVLVDVDYGLDEVLRAGRSISELYMGWRI